ncbi:MAG: hypothetical protein WDZ70_00295 [Candidatus Paceibacterota bacterium]
MVDATNAQAAQNFVPIKEIRNGVVVLKNGSLRSVLMASSLNFALKSQDEQTSIILQFQNFLNSLDFSVQFYVQSRELDIRPYVALLEEQYKEQVNDLLKIQTREYIEFVKTFTKEANIMSKNFFIVVPYTPPVFESGKGITSILPGKKKKVDKKVQEASFEEYRTQLEQRMSVVEQGLVRTGVRVVQLGTEELIELFYKIFNPGDSEKPVQLEARKQQ